MNLLEESSNSDDGVYISTINAGEMAHWIENFSWQHKVFVKLDTDLVEKTTASLQPSKTKTL